MDDRKFEIRCEAGPEGHLHVKSRSLSVALSQLVKRNRVEELWQSVLVICEENPDGSVLTKIIVCHPDWDQNLQIASILSRIPEGDEPSPVLEVDLKSVRV
jgi:hypothetical protein